MKLEEIRKEEMNREEPMTKVDESPIDINTGRLNRDDKKMTLSQKSSENIESARSEINSSDGNKTNKDPKSNNSEEKLIIKENQF